MNTTLKVPAAIIKNNRWQFKYSRTNKDSGSTIDAGLIVK